MACFCLPQNFVEIYSFCTFKWQKGPLSAFHTPKCWCYCSCNSLSLWPEMLQEGFVQSRASQAWWPLLVSGGGLFLTHVVGGSSKDMDPPPQGVPEETAQLHNCVTGTALGLRIFCCRPMSAILSLTYPRNNSDALKALENHLPSCLNNLCAPLCEEASEPGGLCLAVY